MKESDFLKQLESKTLEQRKIFGTEIIPEWARGMADWLAVHPWRVLVPGAGIVYLVLRIMLGIQYREWILGLFGGFAK